ncbi:hypothetical protein LTR78_004724 [Recurvomyces mirabilis]|uniref:Beta-lactamase-related domain-containing protein n=1 Tax=Recurvomyces mirabilis TaxID=574656 RepID=A0AAE1C242_9PEZI|nr:hypothetical protein LTR78_004724 [Recurvomyces mirabilis]KAK5157896.1 hypothetical protein LTS14_003818 [Recurvomyces mirabilis]
MFTNIISFPSSLLALTALSHHVEASCEPNAAFLANKVNHIGLNSTLATIDSVLNNYLSKPDAQASSLSIQITTSQVSIWSKYHTPNISTQAEHGHGVDGSTTYRIASNTKIFTAMAVLQQQAKGKIDLDHAVSDYVPELKNSSGSIQWNRISIRSLLSQQSGPEQFDLLTEGVAEILGLPPVIDVEFDDLPACDLNVSVACDRAGLLNVLREANPVFPPHTEASYSNVGFDLLGLVIEAVTGMPYEDYITIAITKPLGMNATTFTTSSNTSGAFLASDSQWSQDLAVGNAAGGLYSSSDDMTRFMRYLLKHHQTISPMIDWFEPVAYSAGSHSLIGMPWEIFRATTVLPQTNRPVTFITKGGGLTGYYSYVVLISQYDLAITMLSAGSLGSFNSLLDAITTTLVRGAEDLAQRDLAVTYTGTYNDANLNSSITLAQSSARSLYISAWTSNDTDVLAQSYKLVSALGGVPGGIYYQVVPTFETRLQANLTGQVWRFYNVQDTLAESNVTSQIWNDYCVTNVDPLNYAGKPFNEMVFWFDGDKVASVVLTAFNATLMKDKTK